MLQKTYSVYADDLSDVQLYIEAGKNHFACWCKKENDDRLKAFEFFLCDDYDAENFEELVDNIRLYSRLLTMPVNTTLFYWNTNEVLCLPPGNDSEDFLKSNFELLFGDVYDKNFYSSLTDKCFVCWAVEKKLQQVAQESFRGSTFSNHYSLLFSSLKATAEAAGYLLFYPNYFTLIALKENKLLFAQTKKYALPEDVLYIVLNVFNQYKIEITTAVYCGGFIDEQSKLYEMLYQYLEGFQLMKTNDVMFENSEFTTYPSHYFAPYINYNV